MVMVVEMTTDRGSFANARIDFGLTTGIDEMPHELIIIERAEGPRLFGEYKFLFLENKHDFNIEVSSFGYINHREVGTLDRRLVFSPAECEAIERLIRGFFTNPDVFNKKFLPPVGYLGFVFRADWILQAPAKH